MKFYETLMLPSVDAFIDRLYWVYNLNKIVYSTTGVVWSIIVEKGVEDNYTEYNYITA